MMQILTDWPGKSAPALGGSEHPAVYHMLDAAAVAETLLAPLPDWKRKTVTLCPVVEYGTICAGP